MKTLAAHTWAIVAVLAIAFDTSATLASEGATLDQRSVSYHQDIEPIFRQHCFGCHQGAKQMGTYLMTDFARMITGGESENLAIVPGNPSESYLIDQIRIVDGHAEMPKPPAKPLSEVEVELISRWIAEGAKNDSPAGKGPRFSRDAPPVYTGPPSLPSIDVSTDGRLIAVAGFHEVVLLNVDDGKILSRLVGMSPRINTVRFSPDGKQLVAVGGTPAVSGELQIWDVESADLILSLPMTYDTLSGASWSPDGTKIAFGAADNTLRAVDSKTGEQVLFQGAHDDWVRDTAFTPDSTHVVSVARDMTTKLTEVATERFIDNITSITPGALSGGLSSVVSHPSRNEILVGGADGVPKLYRVFRETERKIGDDANLIRSMPKMPGRIGSVDISPDGSRIAAAATIDGRSEVRVWEYDFDGELSDDLKKILAKRVADRDAEEKKRVDQYRSQPTDEVFKVSVDEAAVYAVCFAADNSVCFAGNDGLIRHLDADGTELRRFAAANFNDEAKSAKLAFDAKAWTQRVASQQPTAGEPEPVDLGTIEEIVVQPRSILLNSPYSYAQLVVTAVAPDGQTSDVTRRVTLDVPACGTASPHGLIRPTQDGKGIIKVSLGKHSANIDFEVVDVSGDDESIGAVDFIRDVNPVLSRLGCNQGTCHGAQKGKNGFRLSLRGYDPVFDLRALTDDLAARRINPAAPNESIMLRKPLGLSPHQGGTLMTSGDPNHVILHRWIADGSHLNLKTAKVKRLEVFPVNPIVESTKAQQQVRVVAYYPDGASRDVTQDAFIESGNTEVATAADGGMLSALRRGEAPILARYEGTYAATTLTVMGDRSDYQEVATESWGKVDELVAKKWQRVKVVPSELCDDATFLRRVHLDLTGLPPSSDDVREFLADETSNRDKRARVIDSLLGSEAYVDFWTNKWADLLQVNRKFLGVEGSTKFRDWIRSAVAENRPYDKFAKQILTASGSNHDNPAASYFKVLRDPDATMENTTHLFLGIRFNCNKCHDHPFERWTQDQYYEMSAFFAQVKLENDPVSGERKVGGTAVEGAKPLFEKVVDGTGEIQHPSTNQDVVPEFPFPVPHDEPDEPTRRQRLAHWMTAADNPYFAKSYVNRLWGYLMGVGLIEPIDDIRAGNPATNPELLDHLTRSFVQSGFDIQDMLRRICNSRTYQLDVQTNALNEDDLINYSHALPRRLPAEVIYDCVHAVTGAVSDIPGMPRGTRAAALTDSGVQLADGFLQNLGRPARESACECERSSDLQLGPVMALISGPTIGTAISDPKNELQSLVSELPDDEDLAEEIFLRALGRLPSESELSACGQMSELIKQDHVAIVEQLRVSEEAWKTKRLQLETQREAKLATVKQQIVDRTLAIKDERERLLAEREERIRIANAALENAQGQIGEQVDRMTEEYAKNSAAKDTVEWVPLRPLTATSTNKAVLKTLADRSILVSGSKDKGVYHLQFKTGLQNITGVRIEALTDPSLPNQGPGLPSNGNFVVTELEIKVGSSSNPKESTPVKIASAHADYLQNGFAIEQTFDGNAKNQKGWAVSPETGKEHWATFKFEKPIVNRDDDVIHLALHQFHNANEHRLGRFRISVTNAGGDIPLGYSESVASALSIPRSQRSDIESKVLMDFVSANDEAVIKAKANLAVANQAVPPDETLVALQNRQQFLETPTPDDPELVQLRDDAKQSIEQVAKLRLTAAEDLTWALINSPAFLFNH
ncbi:translocation protein TolB [Rubripirellula amarantea]|uniref:Translocation protein TolB n=1 Tax=Rubripirellula amarantea TaxID=2527999 RepID=A0A5C5WU34_9BACT|nr:DUF1549 domain-containing protein [Rubripirellula amarantea]TWT54196.1 translocation protein TolB [Rubripirellula amarantea]